MHQQQTQITLDDNFASRLDLPDWIRYTRIVSLGISKQNLLSSDFRRDAQIPYNGVVGAPHVTGQRAITQRDRVPRTAGHGPVIAQYMRCASAVYTV